MATLSHSNSTLSRQFGEIRFTMEGFQQTLNKNLYSMWQSSDFCDLTLKLSGDEEIHVHSCLLAAVSPTIADILYRTDVHFHEKGESCQKYIVIDVQRFSGLVMEAIIRLLYTGQFHLMALSQMIVKQLLEASRWLKIKRLITTLEKIVGVNYLSNADLSDRVYVNVAVLEPSGSVLFKTQNIIVCSNSKRSGQSISKSSTPLLSSPSSLPSASISTQSTSSNSPLPTPAPTASQQLSPAPNKKYDDRFRKPVSSIQKQSEPKSTSMQTSTTESSHSRLKKFVHAIGDASTRFQQRSNPSSPSQSVKINNKNSQMIMTENENDEPVPEIKMEIDDLSDFLSSCDALNAVDVANLGVGADRINNGGVMENGDNIGSIIDTIKEEIEDKNDTSGETEVASLMPRYIETNYSLVHDHVYSFFPEKSVTEKKRGDSNNNQSRKKESVDKNKRRRVEVEASSSHEDTIHFELVVTEQSTSRNDAITRTVDSSSQEEGIDKNKRKQTKTSSNRKDMFNSERVVTEQSISRNNAITRTVDSSSQEGMIDKNKRKQAKTSSNRKDMINSEQVVTEQCTSTSRNDAITRTVDSSSQVEEIDSGQPVAEQCTSMNDTITWNDFSRDSKQVDNNAETHFDVVDDVEVTPAFVCDKCGAWFIYKIHYEEHVNDHPLHSCSLCPAKFHLRVNLDRHTKSLHNPTPSDLEQLQRHRERLNRVWADLHANMIHKCQQCSYSAVTVVALCRHSIKEHGESKPLKCDIEGCSFRACKPSTISKHKNTTHGAGKKITCDRCQATLKNMLTYRSHRMTCLKLSECLCDVCGKKFTSRQNLILHVKSIHGGLRKYKCPRCPHAFSCQANLKRHMLLHNNAFPFSCTECGKKFRHSNTLKAHLQTVHLDSS